MSKQEIIRNRIYWICVYVISCISILVMFLLFLYPDLKSITAWSFDLLDCVFRGDLAHYYDWQQLNRFGANHLTNGGNYLPMFVTAIWDLPGYLFYRGSGSTGALTAKYYFWQKLFYLVLILVVAYTVFKLVAETIDVESKKEYKKTITFLMLSSPAIVFSCFYFGQDEIIYVTALLIAIWAYIKEKNKTFWIMSVISVMLCPITLLPILYLLVLREKRIYILLVQLLVLNLPSIVFDLLYRNVVFYTEHKTSMLSWISGMLSSASIGLQFGNVSLVGIAFTIMFFYVYFKKTVDYTKEEIIYGMALLMCLLGFGTVQIWYRFLIATPFLIMLVMIQKENRNLNLFLLFLVAVCRGLQIISDNMVLNPQYLMQNGLSMKIANVLTCGGFMWKESLHNALNYGERSFDSVYPLLGCVCYGVLGILFWINRPRAKKVYQFEIPEKVSLAGMALINFAILLAFFLIGGPGWKWVISV